MPVIKSARKKLRKDRIRTKRNKNQTDILKTALKKAKKTPTQKSIREAVSMLDKAVKKKLMHKNKASRIKSKLSKLISIKSGKTGPSKTKTPRKNKAKNS